ncbi:methylenetetrahydrofolate reductase [Enteractinococcus coprophilus]|uniref:Methylenetetrahydrofolate reductase n=1 Tax=Enteractinococcus coprophilus TaxID=1027633 RepID=A0A543AGT5_9MICC|nr:methylenetetrahydrofolate reductase [Enteractinococcus coprophilus]TQL71783.1 methylenetetrahydrofolate reductase (NADPH) [Enteractinococcus coprophilus]
MDFTTPSFETTVRQVGQFVDVADRMPGDAPINVAFVEEISVAQRLAAIRTLSAAGLRVRPILSARRLASEAQLGELLETSCGKLGLQEVMIVGGDPTEPAGPYATALKLIQSAPITEADLRLIALPGFPKEHPTTSSAVLLDHLAAKVDALEATERAVEITTQLCLDPAAVQEWVTKVRARGITAPIRIGVPAPTTAAKLLRFCALCKVDATQEDLQRYGWLADHDATLVDPGAFLRSLTRMLTSELGPIMAHIYPMGDIGAALTWLSSRQVELMQG